MKKIIGLSFCVAALAAMLTGCGPKAEAPMEVSVTTYNLLGRKHYYKSPWEDRKEKVGEIIRQENNNPDILGCNEVWDSIQLNDVIGMLRDEYDWRDMEIEVSPRAIFWRKSRFEAVGGANLDLLADHPEYAPEDYYTSRWANHVRLREIATGREVLVYCVHVKAGGRKHDEYQLLRRQCVEAVARAAKAESERLGGLPIIALGDLNNYAKTVLNGVPSAPMTFVENGFGDTFDMAAERVNEGYKTYSSQACIDEGVATKAGLDERLDYIFVYPAERFTVGRWAAIINFLPGSDIQVEKPIPSDHHPVNVRMTIDYTNL